MTAAASRSPQRIERRAAFAPSTLDLEARTVDVVVATGAPLEQTDPMTGERFLLQLEMTPGAVRLTRFASGGPVMRDHRHDSIEMQLGAVRRAWLAGGMLHATVAFSERAEPYWLDVQRGILRDVSVGALAHRIVEKPAPRGETPLRVATDWEPIELSFIPIGLDPGAVVRSDPCAPAGATERTTMEREATEPEDTSAERVERQRATDILKAAQAAKLPIQFATDLIDRGVPTDVARSAVLGELAKRDEATTQRAHVLVGEDYDRGPAKFERMAEGMAARWQSKIEPTDGARPYLYATQHEIALEVLRATGVRGFEPRNKASVIQRALSTSDYPLLLADAANKMLLPEWQAATPAFRKIAAPKDFNDFRAHKFLRSGDFPNLLEVGEGGEIKLGALSESREQVTLATYGRRLALTRQMLVNDDVGGFADLVMKGGRRAADFENALFFTVLLSGSGLGPTLGDGGTLFNATATTTPGGHANYTSSGTAIAIESLGIGRAMIQKQKSLDGLALNIEPGVLLTSPDKRTLAEQYVAQIAPALASSSNPFTGRLEVVSDANLTSANPWYLFAAPTTHPAFVFGYLAGQQGPRIETRIGFEVEGLEIKVAEDFGVGAIDWRGAYKNAGA